MRDRTLIVLLVVVVAFIFYVKPTRENIGLMKTRLIVLDSQIAAQEIIKRQHTDIDRRLKVTAATAKINEGYLYSVGKSASLALADLQDFVKRTATADKLEVVSSTWGEAVDDSKTGLTRIPMTFIIRGAPPAMDQFLQKLIHGERFVKIERATITKFQDQQLLLNVSLVALKRDGGHE